MPEGLGPQIKGTKIVALCSEQALFRFDEAQGVKEVLLRNLSFSCMIDIKAIPVLDVIYREFRPGLILDPVAFLEVDTDQGGGGENVLPHFFSGGKANFDPVALRGDDEPQAEFRLGCTGPSLTGEGVLHGRESGGRWAWRQG